MQGKLKSFFCALKIAICRTLELLVRNSVFFLAFYANYPRSTAD